MSSEVICGDCLEVMRGMADNSIDTIITDPPYGLEFMGKEWDSFSDNTNSALGGQSPANKKEGTPFKKRGKPIRGWCEKDKQANVNFYRWNLEWATEALRVAKPGAMLMAFGGTRTYHRLTCAIEDAGWQIRDCVMYVYGSGFPKSHDISKGIDKTAFHNWLKEYPDEAVKYREQMEQAKGDSKATAHVERKFRKAAGAKRRIVGQKDVGPDFTGDNYHRDDGKRMIASITAPATDEAKAWDGYGTALKPAWEPIVLAMKPLDGTFAQNAIKWGVAGLWIDGGRVAGEPWKWGTQTDIKGGGYGSKRPSDGDVLAKNVVGGEKGRWPANLILSHHPDCVRRGAKKIKNMGGVPKTSKVKDSPVRLLGKERTASTHYFDSDGMEMVEAWDCVEDCPMKLFPQTKSGKPVGMKKAGTGYHGNFPGGDMTGFGDTGTAARFFYCAKVGKAERNKGCEDLDEKIQNSDGKIRTYNDRCATCKKKFIGPDDKICHCPKGEKITDKTVYRNPNNHPTVKPISLMRYLCKLTRMPEGGTVLDPFMGSGSTGIAAKLEGRNFIGIEKEKDYCEIAKNRIEAWEIEEVAEDNQGEFAFEEGV